MSNSSAELSTRRARAHPLAELSRGLVHLFRQRAGRGPTEARAFWAGDDAVLVLLGGGYTKAEQTLARQGRPEPALAYRQAVLATLEDEMRAALEASLGRRVEVVMGAAYHDPDVMAVVFLLEPLGGSGSAGRWGTGEEPVPPALTDDGAQPT